MDSLIEDAGTAELMKPWHRRWCKRPLFHDEYLPTFNRPNVPLVDTDGQGVERFTESGVVVAGVEYPLDCMIFASGFEMGSAFTDRCGFEIRGRDGQQLGGYWREGVRSFHGVQANGFPNLFFNNQTQNSTSVNYSWMLQNVAEHVAYILGEVRSRGGVQVEPTAQAVADYDLEARPDGPPDTSFWASCTPGYHNNEGAPEKANAYLGNIFTRSPHAFYQLLKDWRSEDDLEGLQIS